MFTVNPVMGPPFGFTYLLSTAYLRSILPGWRRLPLWKGARPCWRWRTTGRSWILIQVNARNTGLSCFDGRHSEGCHRLGHPPRPIHRFVDIRRGDARDERSGNWPGNWVKSLRASSAFSYPAIRPMSSPTTGFWIRACILFRNPFPSTNCPSRSRRPFMAVYPRNKLVHEAVPYSCHKPVFPVFCHRKEEVMITLLHTSGAVVLFPFFAIIFQIRVKTLEFLKPGILISLLGKSAPKKLLIG